MQIQNQQITVGLMCVCISPRRDYFNPVFTYNILLKFLKEKQVFSILLLLLVLPVGQYILCC